MKKRYGVLVIDNFSGSREDTIEIELEIGKRVDYVWEFLKKVRNSYGEINRKQSIMDEAKLEELRGKQND